MTVIKIMDLHLNQDTLGIGDVQGGQTVIHGYHLPWTSSDMDITFHWSHLPWISPSRVVVFHVFNNIKKDNTCIQYQLPNLLSLSLEYLCWVAVGGQSWHSSSSLNTNRTCKVCRLGEFARWLRQMNMII